MEAHLGTACFHLLVAIGYMLERDYMRITVRPLQTLTPSTGEDGLSRETRRTFVTYRQDSSRPWFSLCLNILAGQYLHLHSSHFMHFTQWAMRPLD